MVMDENEFNEQLLFYLNGLKEFNFEADPKVQKFKKCLEDVIKMEDIKLEDVEIYTEENSEMFGKIFGKFDSRLRAKKGQSLGMIEIEAKKGDKKIKGKVIVDPSDIVAISLAFICVFGVITGKVPVMIISGPLCVFLKSKNFNRDEVIEELKELDGRRKN